MQYDIFQVLSNSISQFDNTSVNVVPSITDNQGKRYLQPEDNGYQFSQRKMLADIDLAYNSIFKGGKYDREGQRKLYLNKVRFYNDVAMKNTDIDIKNYVFSPADYSTSNIWSVWFTERQFSNFVQDSGYDSTIDDTRFDWSKYGSCVSKRLKDDVIRIPIRSIRCDQAATTLMEGIEGGTPMSIEHDLSYVQMKKMKGWDIPDYFTGKRLTYEVYTYMPRCEVARLNNKKSNDEEMVLTLSILMPAGKMDEDKRKKFAPKVLFVEEMSEDDFPFEECHFEKQEGRWLGRGNVERILDNQIASNLSANLRRRSMLWASKQIFQTQGDVVNKNLVKNVQDGEVLQVGLNGLIQKVDTTSRALSDFAADEEVWSENTQQQSFAFESATGESMPSGTAFRLGALLSNTVMSYFDGKKETFGKYLHKAFFSQLIPIFQKRAKDDLFVIAQSDQGFASIKTLFLEWQTNDHYLKMALHPDMLDIEKMPIVPSLDEVRAHVDEHLTKSPYYFVDIPKEVYKNAKYTLKLDITGEERDTADRETLTTLYTTMKQSGDPRAEKVLDVLLASMGKNLAAIAGNAPMAQPAAQQQSATAQNPNLTGLTPDATQQ